MNISMFLILLSAFSVISSLITEGIKRIIKDKTDLSYNIIALVVAMIVGVVGCVVYYLLSDISFTAVNVICMVLMGLASGLVSMVGFDKVKQLIGQITNSIKKD